MVGISANGYEKKRGKLQRSFAKVVKISLRFRVRFCSTSRRRHGEGARAWAVGPGTRLLLSHAERHLLGAVGPDGSAGAAPGRWALAIDLGKLELYARGHTFLGFPPLRLATPRMGEAPAWGAFSSLQRPPARGMLPNLELHPPRTPRTRGRGSAAPGSSTVLGWSPRAPSGRLGERSERRLP